MEAKKEYEVDHLSTPTGTSFSQLLFGDDDDDVDESALGLAVDQSYSYNYNNLTRSPLFSIHKAPQMLCFANHQNQGDVLLPETNVTPQKSVITSSDSSSASASSCNHTNTAFNSLPKSNVSHSVDIYLFFFFVSNWRMILVVVLIFFFSFCLFLVEEFAEKAKWDGARISDQGWCWKPETN